METNIKSNLETNMEPNMKTVLITGCSSGYGLEIARHPGRILDPAHGVVGVHQKGAQLREQRNEMLEGLALAVVRHDVAMRHRAVQRWQCLCCSD